MMPELVYHIEVPKIRSEIQYWLGKSPKMGAPHIPRALEQNDCIIVALGKMFPSYRVLPSWHQFF